MSDVMPLVQEGPDRNRQLAAAVAVALAVVALGQRIPLPGLNLDAIGAQASQSSGLWARVSILALGIWPLFTALAFAEIVRLVFLAVARRRGAATRDSRWAWIAVRFVALGLAAVQGSGILVGLEASGLADPEAAAFKPVGLACFLGATALVVWLADRCRPLGIWPLFSAPYLVSAPAEAWAWFDLMRTGAASPQDVLLPAAYVVAAATLTVFAYTALAKSLRPGDERNGVPIAILVWPPFLAGVAGGVVSAPIFFAMPQLADSAATLGSVRALTIVVLVPLFVWLYARSYAPTDAGTAGASPIAPVLLLVAATQVVVCLVGDVVLRLAPVPFSLAGGPLIMLVTVLLVLGRSLGLQDLPLQRFSRPEASAAS